MSQRRVLILGAGMTGLAVGYASGLAVYEQAEVPGGICSSYYMRPVSIERLHIAPKDGEAYRFEIGGGHWIFGGDPLVLRSIRSLTPVKSYVRRSAVYFPYRELFVSYPIQNHLRCLGQKIAVQALQEIANGQRAQTQIVTMADWLKSCFGPTLYELFFEPFHELYTAGLFWEIAPQDAYKTPVDLSLVIQGAFDDVPQVGYNATFIYPEEGLNILAQRMAERCQVHYGKRVIRIDVKAREIYSEDGTSERYDELISTLPLNQVVKMTGLDAGERPDPVTSVLVVNIGAEKGPRCPPEHWVYVPRSRAGFHRVGFYSNVDPSFLPASARGRQDRVSIYVEKAYREGVKPTEPQVASLCRQILDELQDWGWVKQVELMDTTWIDVAYTWSLPKSNWVQKTLEVLQMHNIFQIGRYGQWRFQGIADSIRDGLVTGSAVRGG